MNSLRTILILSLLLSAAGGCGAGAVSQNASMATQEPGEQTGMPTVLVRRTPSSSGSLEGDLVGRVLVRSAEELGACYETAGGAAIGEGVVYLLLDIDEAGRLSRSTVGHSDIRSVRFETCLRRTLGELSYPTSLSESVVQTHLVFGASDFDDGRGMMRAYRASRAPALATAESDDAVSLSGLRNRIQSCYERSRRGRPWLRGRMVLELTVEQDGLVSEAAVSDGGLDRQLNQCVLSAVRNLRIEGEYASAATLQYPVILEPGR